MDDNESYTAEDLEKCSYRYLQQVAKTMKLPANVKKVHLIKMIHAKKYRSKTDFQNIVENVCHERKQLSRMRKVDYRFKIQLVTLVQEVAKIRSPKKKALTDLSLYSLLVLYPNNKDVDKGVDDNTTDNNKIDSIYMSEKKGKEVTSTGRYSPPGPVSPKHAGHIIIRCPENSKSSILKSIPMQTDRVLRSKGREPGKYRFLNTVIGVIKPENKSANTQRHAISSQGRRFMDRRPKFVINKFKTNILNCNQSMLKINEDETHLQIYAEKPGPVTSTPLPSKRLRTISGIYPLNPSAIEPQRSYTSKKTINFRRQGGTISRINLTQPDFNTSFENFVENKKQNEVTVTVQDIINSNIEEQVFSNTNMTEYVIADSVQQKNNDYPNMSMVTETTSFINQPTSYKVLENPVLNQTKNKIRNCLKERQSLRIEISNPEVSSYTGSEVLRNLLLMTQPESFNNNQHKTYQNEPSFVVNQTKYPNPQLSLNIPQSNCNTNQLNCNLPQLNSSLAENQSMFENDDSYGFSVYYHKKIRAEQVRSKRNTFQRESSREDDCLPKISQAFSRFNNVDKDYAQPLYMQVSDESERTVNNPVYIAKPNNTSILESLYNFKNTFITNEPFLKLVTTSNTKCVYSTPIISTPIARTSLGEPIHFTSHEPDSQQLYTENNRGSMPRIGDCLLQDQVHMQSEFTHDMSDLSSTSDSLSHDPNVSIPEMVEDALELISQDGDYMERINMDMDVRVQCFLCDWAGPRIILEYHVRKEHTIQTVSLNGSWRVVFTLTFLRNVWNSRVLEKNEQLYVISSKWEDNCLFATLTTISDCNLTPKSGSITFFNRITLEHITWQGDIRQLHSNMPYENYNDGLTVNFSNTDVFENISEINECFFTFFVKVLD